MISRPCALLMTSAAETRKASDATFEAAVATNDPNPTSVRGHRPDAQKRMGQGHREERGSQPQAHWLWWDGPEPPLLKLMWRAYVARFGLEDPFCFNIADTHLDHASGASPRTS